MAALDPVPQVDGLVADGGVVAVAGVHAGPARQDQQPARIDSMIVGKSL